MHGHTRDDRGPLGFAVNLNNCLRGSIILAVSEVIKVVDGIKEAIKGN